MTLGRGLGLLGVCAYFAGSCLLAACGGNKPPALCDECDQSGGTSSGASAGVGGSAGLGGSAGNGTSGAGVAGSGAGTAGVGAQGGSAGQGSQCKGTPTVSCASAGCDRVAGCVVMAPSSCSGTASACSAFDAQASACAAQAGCGMMTQGGYCFDYYDHSDCSYYQNDYNNCTKLSGCTWNGIDGSCKGTVIDCTKLTFQTQCQAQYACQWVPEAAQYCEGQATSCDKLAGDACAAQQGCSATPGACSGTPTPCAELSAADCGKVPGCSTNGGGGAGGSGGLAQLPDLTVSSLALAIVKDDTGKDVFDFGYIEVNRGSVLAGAHENDIVVSTDDQLGNADDVLISSDSVTKIEPYGTAFISQPEAYYDIATFTNVVPSGYYYIGFIVDAKRAILESDEMNNAFLSDKFFIGTPTIDVKASALGTDVSGTLAPGDTFNVTLTVTNLSNITLASVPIGLVLSTDASIDAGDLGFCNDSKTVNLAPGAQTSVSVACSAPRLRGAYYVGATLDPSNTLGDVDPSNNRALSAAPIDIDAPSPDLVISALDMDSTDIAWSGSVGLSATVKNTGVDPAGAFKVALFASKNTSLDAGASKLCELPVDALAAGASTIVSSSCAIPGTFIGQTYVIAQADSADAVFETNEANNTLAATSALTVENPDWDLSVATLADNAGDTLIDGKTVTYQVVANNNGTDRLPSFDLSIYLSVDQTITTSDTLVCKQTVNGIAGSSNGTYTFQCDLPTLALGTSYYVGVVLDPANALVETDESNNRLASSSSRPAVAQ